jgi:hypothetical protein
MHGNDIEALARSRQEEALRWAERQRLIRLASLAGADVAGPGARPGSAEARAAAELRQSIDYLGRLARVVVLVALLVLVAAALTGFAAAVVP